MKIGQMDSRGRTWTSARQRALDAAHAAKRNGGRRPAQTTRTLKYGDTATLLVRAIRKMVKSEVRTILKRSINI